MKFVKRISLFFIYPLTMFAMGFASNMAIMEFFYPGDQRVPGGQSHLEDLAGPEALDDSGSDELTERNPPPPPEDDKPADAQKELLQPREVEVSVSDEPVVTANTRYVLQQYDVLNDVSEEAEEVMPDKFIGLTRQKLVDEIDEYNLNPSLADQEQGFTYMELVSFSSGRVVVRKSYERAQEGAGFFLLNENHFVAVYDHTLSHVYMETDILVEGLPESLQQEILNMKYVEDEKELYQFLESWSS